MAETLVSKELYDFLSRYDGKEGNEVHNVPDEHNRVLAIGQLTPNVKPQSI